MLTPEEQAKLGEAMASTEGHAKSEVVNEALRQLTRSQRRSGLLALRGKVRWEGDIDALRKRSPDERR